MKRIGVLIVTAMLLSAFALAQEAPVHSRERSSITVRVDGLHCTTTLGTGTFPALSWTFGASQSATPVTRPGGPGDKVSLSNLSVSKSTDVCSPALFGDVASGKLVKTVTITQLDQATDSTFTVTLSDVIVSLYQVSGNTTDVAPVESVSFNFAKICMADSETGAKFCWDSLTNRTF